eukprot:2000956-Pyramimonas_sp.AAC.1
MLKTETRRQHRSVVFPGSSPPLPGGQGGNGPGALDAGAACPGRRAGGGQPGRRVAGEVPVAA